MKYSDKRRCIEHYVQCNKQGQYATLYRTRPSGNGNHLPGHTVEDAKTISRACTSFKNRTIVEAAENHQATSHSTQHTFLQESYLTRHHEFQSQETRIIRHTLNLRRASQCEQQTEDLPHEIIASRRQDVGIKCVQVRVQVRTFPAIPLQK